ncbi:MAG: type II toxin-antitoxin system VapC family toxin [Anaerolineae bacterium]|nr:type II toxin-antitoxin system VapC family toxin [Anaerolineae bacterium]
MKAVVDANVALALVLPLPYSPQAQALWESWRAPGTLIYAPDLWAYEITAALRKAMVTLRLPLPEAETRLQTLLALGVRLAAPTMELHLRALLWAERAGQTVAYDGHYLALAEALNCEFWTADARLARGLQNQYPWVRLLQP